MHEQEHSPSSGQAPAAEPSPRVVPVQEASGMAVWVLGLVTSGLAAAALSALALGVIALTGMMHLLGAHAGASGQP